MIDNIYFKLFVRMDLGRLVVGFVVFLIVYIGYTGQYIFYKYFEEFNIKLILLCLIYNALVLLLLYNYYLAVNTDPGKVPKGWTPDPNAPFLQVKKSNLKPRYCKACKVFKPPRTHHCSSCERCVLKMDHHCPWLNNCVGYHNLGHFIRFLFYVNITTSISLFIFIKHLIQMFDTSYYLRRYSNISKFEVFLLMSNLVLCVPVFICVFFLSMFQFYGISENTTTIENMEKDKVANLVKSGKVSEVKFPYDIGIIKNIRSVLGDSILLWLWPQNMDGNGIDFEIKIYEDEEGVVWPPPEYTKPNKKKQNYLEEDEMQVEYDKNDDGEYLIPIQKYNNKSTYQDYLDDSENSENSDLSNKDDDDDDDDDIYLDRKTTRPKPYLPVNTKDDADDDVPLGLL